MRGSFLMNYGSKGILEEAWLWGVHQYEIDGRGWLVILLFAGQ